MGNIRVKLAAWPPPPQSKVMAKFWYEYMKKGHVMTEMQEKVANMILYFGVVVNF